MSEQSLDDVYQKDEKRFSGDSRKRVAAERIQPRAGGLFHAVVGGFFGDHYVVDVGFAEARGGDADELAFFG
jgi:hypothetical protein